MNFKKELYMPELLTLAKPYAKAAFNFAVKQNNIDHWKSMLIFSAAITHNNLIKELLFSSIQPEKMANIFLTICGNHLDTAGQIFIKIMAEHNRLIILPIILNQYISMCNNMNNLVEVELISFNPLKEEQKVKIISIIEKRLSSKINLHYKIDKSILAGIIIRIGDMIIDNSIKSRLNRLACFLKS